MARCCRRAVRAGVHPGMTLAHARALLPAGEVRVEPFDAGRDAAALGALSEWATRYLPVVAVDAPDGLLMDATGCHRLYGSRKRLMALLAERVERLGFAARIAAAPTFAGAWAAARYGPEVHTIVDPGDIRRTLAGLPVAALRLEAPTREALGEVGITQVGHLFDLPRSQLAARFGEALLRRLDQATGEVPEPIEPLHPVAPPCVERSFSGPVKQLEAIRITVHQLTVELGALLQHRQCGARRIELTVQRSDADPLHLTVHLSRPNRDARHLRSLLAPKVERLNMGFGVLGMVLTAPRTETMRHEQIEAWRDGDAPDAAEADRVFGRLLDTMTARLGADRVTRAEPVATHIPERAFRRRAATDSERRGVWDTPVAPTDRPPDLFRTPQPVRAVALAPDGPPSALIWNGCRHRIVASAGPERIGREWWRGRRERRASDGNQHHPAQSMTNMPPAQYSKSEFPYERQHSLSISNKPTETQEGETEANTSANHHPSSLSLSAAVDRSVAPSLSPSCLSSQSNKADHQNGTRDYFRVCDEEGHWLWVFRELESGKWFVHGRWS